MNLRSFYTLLAVLALSVQLMLAAPFMAQAADDGSVTPEEAAQMILNDKNLVILDMRTPNEHAVAHFPTATLIPITELEARLSEVPSGKPVLVHCAKGVRAKRGYDLLKAKRPDITEIHYLVGEPIF